MDIPWNKSNTLKKELCAIPLEVLPANFYQCLENIMTLANFFLLYCYINNISIVHYYCTSILELSKYYFISVEPFFPLAQLTIKIFSIIISWSYLFWPCIFSTCYVAQFLSQVFIYSSNLSKVLKNKSRVKGRRLEIICRG